MMAVWLVDFLNPAVTRYRLDRSNTS